MPELKEYVNRENIQPTDRGTEARVQEGRRVGAFFNQRAESLRDFGNRTAQEIGGAIRDAGDAAVQYQTHRQLNQGIDTYWQLRETAENDWNDVVKGNPDKGISPADPHDPGVAQRFLEQNLKPKLQAWQETFSTEAGQTWARNRVDSLTGHFQQKTATEMGELAAQQIDTSLRSIGNRSANVAYRSPESLKQTLDDIDVSVDTMTGSSPNLKGAHAGKVNTVLREKYHEQAALAAGRGVVENSRNPVAASEKFINDNSKDLTQPAQENIRAHARSEVRAMRVDEANQRHLEDLRIKKLSDDTKREYLDKLYSGDQKLMSQLNSRDINNDRRMTTADADYVIRHMERETKPETEKRYSDATENALWVEMSKPDMDPVEIEKKITAARSKLSGPGSLTRQGYLNAMQDLLDRKTPKGLALAGDRDRFMRDVVGPTIDGGMVGNVHSALGRIQMNEVYQALKREEDVLKSKSLNPHILYDNQAREYFGNRLGPYARSMQDVLNYQFSIGTTPTPASRIREGFAAAAGAKEPDGSRERPFTVPAGTTPDQIKTLIPSGRFFVAPDGKVRQVP